MNSTFYLKMAIRNIKKQKQFILPYVLVGTFIVMMFYMMANLTFHPSFEGTNTSVFMAMGMVILSLFSIVFIFYTNSFLMKRRKREFGIFNILGMEKKHIAYVLVIETLMTSIFSILAGLFIGVIFGHLLTLVVGKMLFGGVIVEFALTSTAIKSTTLLFAFIYLMTLLYNYSQIHLSNPIQLLKSKENGEKEPKSKGIVALIGIVCMIVGYVLSMNADDPIKGVSVFFFAVVFVIIGTYCLFTAGSIILLKQLRKNKSYYYQTNHFISVSGMIYRMKQNAVGLANICILSTMVLVTITSTGSLFLGTRDSINQVYPREMRVEVAVYDNSKSITDDLKSIVNQTIKDYDADAKNMVYGEYSLFSYVKENGQLVYRDLRTTVVSLKDIVNVVVMPIEQYNEYKGTMIELNDNEILVQGNVNDKLTVDNQTYQVLQQINDYPSSSQSRGMLDEMIIFMNQEMYQKTRERLFLDGSNFSNVPYSFYYFDVGGSEEFKEQMMDTIYEKVMNYTSTMENGYSIIVQTKSKALKSALEQNGSFLFLGIFLGITFMIAAIMIIYYKQISEGYDDAQRYEILQKVGMSQQEVKQSISSQILFIFFLPLVIAGIHLMGAFPMMKSIFMAFGLVNTKLFILTSIILYIAFCIVYFVVYRLTAKIYYKIVSE